MSLVVIPYAPYQMVQRIHGLDHDSWSMFDMVQIFLLSKQSPTKPKINTALVRLN